MANALLKEMRGIRKDLRHHEKEDDKSMRTIAKHEASEGKSMAKKTYHNSDGSREGGYHKSHTGDMSRHEEYAGIDQRRNQEKADFHMISEDRTAIANMPQNVVMHEWPRHPYGKQSQLNDTIGGVDRQIRDDSSEDKKYEFPEKY
jgi:hypothetical protein